VHALIASPFLDDYLVLRPGTPAGLRTGPARYRQLAQAAIDDPCPTWLVEAVRRAWGLVLQPDFVIMWRSRLLDGGSGWCGRGLGVGVASTTSAGRVQLSAAV
jgi:hypothetical protein